MPRNDRAKRRAESKLKLPLFLKEKPVLLIGGLALLLLIAVGVYGMVALGNGAAEEQLAEGSGEEDALQDEGPETAEVLPQQRRENDGAYDEAGSNEGEVKTTTSFEPSVNPFTDPMRLTGTASGGRDGNMAIIESSGTSYIVSENDYVDDLWSVREVSMDRVILRAHDKEVTLYLDKPPETRSLVPDQDEDEQGDGE